MRVGIITQALLNNYGGILQNYALQQVLNKMGHDVITIDYESHFSLKKYIIYTLKTFFLLFSNKKRRFLSYYRKRSLFNQHFVKQYINTTYSTKKYSLKIIKDYKLDSLVVGSDQVWRPEYNNDLYDMYLSFASDIDNLIRVVYAASFGVDQWMYTKRQTEKCKKLAKQFNAISVRELSGIYLCNKYLEVNAVQVLDPTLLLGKKDYELICNDLPVDESPFLVSYILDMNKKKEEFVNAIGESKNLSVKIIRADENAELSIPEWLSLFRDAKYIVTDSFHGTLFSIIFRKDFVTIGNQKRGLSRFQSVLSNLHLEDRLLVDYTLDSHVVSPIDWEKVESSLNGKIEDSYNFLKNSLNVEFNK